MPSAAFRHIRDLFRPPIIVFSLIILAALDDLGSDLLGLLKENILRQVGLWCMLSFAVSMSSSNRVSEAENRGSLCALASSRYGPLEVRLMDSSSFVAIAGGMLDRKGFSNAVMSPTLGMDLQ